MKKVLNMVVALFLLGGFFSIGLADPLSDLGGGVGSIKARP